MGRLRPQTEEEHRFSMGCHSSVGVTVDQTFTLARKVPGAAGWRYQYLRGILIALPQNVHPEIENGSTELNETGQIYNDGRLWLDWSSLKQ